MSAVEDLLLSADTAGMVGLILVSRTLANKMRQQQQQVKHPAAPPDPNICQCGHGASFHDQEGCHVLVRKAEIMQEDSMGRPTKWKDKTCLCVRFVGPNSVYDPGLDADLAKADKTAKGPK